MHNIVDKTDQYIMMVSRYVKEKKQKKKMLTTMNAITVSLNRKYKETEHFTIGDKFLWSFKCV